MNRWGSCAGLAAVLIFDLWLRCHVVGPALRERYGIDFYPAAGRTSEPLDCDEAIYGYIGDRIAHGAVMYRDLTENKPPGGYWLFTVAVAIGGATELTIRLMPIPFVLVTISLVWWIARTLSGNLTAVLAALIYAIISTDPFTYSDGAQMEVFLNLFGTAALACLIASWERSGRVWLVAAGACLGAACLVKQVAIVHALVFGVALLMRQRDGYASRLRDIATLATGMVAVGAVAALIVIAQGAGAQAFDDIVRYGGALATDTPPPPNAPSKWVRWVAGNADPEGVMPWPFGKTNYLVWWGCGTWPVWLVAVPGMIWLAVGSSAIRRCVAAWTLSAWIQVALPGLFWAHYYQLPLPGIAVIVAVFFMDQCTSAINKRIGVVRRAAHSAVAFASFIALVGTAYIHVNEYLMVPPESLVRDKGGPQWLAQRALGLELARRTEAWDRPRLFVWGWQGTLYFYSGLLNATPQVFVDDLMKNFAGSEHREIKPRVDRMMNDLRSRHPELMYVAYPPFPALRGLLDEAYVRSPLDPGLWVERGKAAEFENAKRARNPVRP